MQVRYGLTAAALLVLVLGIVNAFAFYGGEIYPGDQAKEWMYRARATNDLHDMSVNLGRADTILQSFHGNPGWPYPTPNTDFDQIRNNTETDIKTANTLAGNASLTSFAYQQAVANLQETINEIAGHLGDALGAIWWNPYWNGLGWFVTALDLFLWCWGIGAFIAD